MSSSLETNRQRRVLVTLPIPDEAVDILRSNNLDAILSENFPLSREKLLSSVENIDAIFCVITDKIDREVMEKAGANLKVVATNSVGYDHIDLEECKLRNIPVGYTPDVLTDAMAELTVALILNATRRVSESIEAAKNGKWLEWNNMWTTTKELTGSNLGIFGLGRIGLAVANRLRNFGLNKIIYHNRKTNVEAEKCGYQYVDLDTLLAESDILICTCALTKETEKFFNMDRFKKMKSDAVFINVSRGNVVNQEDLYQALKNRIIASAGLDATSPEPLPTTHELFTLKNCYITPHIGTGAPKARKAMAIVTANNIVNGLNGRPLVHQINI